MEQQRCFSSRLAEFIVALLVPLSTTFGSCALFLYAAFQPRGAVAALAGGLLLWTLYDRNTPARGGRPSSLVSRCLALLHARQLPDCLTPRRLPLWDAFRSYFPATTTALTAAGPGRAHLLCVHPHGVWSCATWCNLFLGTGGMHPTLAALQPRTVTLAVNFWMPLWREWLLALGMISASVLALTRVCADGCFSVLQDREVDRACTGWGGLCSVGARG